jgi:hypothetical protein
MKLKELLIHFVEKYVDPTKLNVEGLSVEDAAIRLMQDIVRLTNKIEPEEKVEQEPVIKNNEKPLLQEDIPESIEDM